MDLLYTTIGVIIVIFLWEHIVRKYDIFRPTTVLLYIAEKLQLLASNVGKFLAYISSWFDYRRLLELLSDMITNIYNWCVRIVRAFYNWCVRVVRAIYDFLDRIFGKIWEMFSREVMEICCTFRGILSSIAQILCVPFWFVHGYFSAALSYTNPHVVYWGSITIVLVITIVLGNMFYGDVYNIYTNVYNYNLTQIDSTFYMDGGKWMMKTASGNPIDLQLILTSLCGVCAMILFLIVGTLIFYIKELFMGSKAQNNSRDVNRSIAQNIAHEDASQSQNEVE